jgi:hypothetical protein
MFGEGRSGRMRETDLSSEERLDSSREDGINSKRQAQFVSGRYAEVCWVNLLLESIV